MAFVTILTLLPLVVLISCASASTGYSTSDQQQLVDEHNKYRSSVSPKATDMLEMKLDLGLAAQAQVWADKCYYFHPNKLAYPDYNNIGQNIFIRYPDKSGVTAPPLTSPVAAWYSEDQYYNYQDNSCAPKKTCGHYTQVVWAQTDKVGCGIKFCKTAVRQNGGETKTYTDAWIVVCNYSPGGNVVGRTPYISGSDSCTACPEGMPCKNNLCTNCDVSQPDCDCKRTCQNCGTVTSDCKCVCPPQYNGESCEQYCENTDSRCGVTWPKAVCGYLKSIDNKCLLMCEKCKPGPRLSCNR